MTLAQQAGIMEATTPPPNKTRTEIIETFMSRDGEDWGVVPTGREGEPIIRGRGFWYTTSPYWPRKRTVRL